MLQQGINSFAPSKSRRSSFCSSSLRRTKPAKNSAHDERELSLRHLRQVLKELEKATEVQERAGARLRASIKRCGNEVQKPARLTRLDCVRKRLTSLRDTRMEIEREIEGLRTGT
jgi:hypothetical protein